MSIWECWSDGAERLSDHFFCWVSKFSMLKKVCVFLLIDFLKKYYLSFFLKHLFSMFRMVGSMHCTQHHTIIQSQSLQVIMLGLCKWRTSTCAYDIWTLMINFTIMRKLLSSKEIMLKMCIFITLSCLPGCHFLGWLFGYVYQHYW